MCKYARVRERPGDVVALQRAAPGGAMQVWVMDLLFLYLQNKVVTSSASQNKPTGHTEMSVYAVLPIERSLQVSCIGVAQGVLGGGTN